MYRSHPASARRGSSEARPVGCGVAQVPRAASEILPLTPQSLACGAGAGATRLRRLSGPSGTGCVWTKKASRSEEAPGGATSASEGAAKSALVKRTAWAHFGTRRRQDSRFPQAFAGCGGRRGTRTRLARRTGQRSQLCCVGFRSVRICAARSSDRFSVPELSRQPVGVDPQAGWRYAAWAIVMGRGSCPWL